MALSRGVGTATSWIPGKHHSYVRIISTESSGDLQIEFQNEKFERITAKLDPREIINKADLTAFMGI